MRSKRISVRKAFATWVATALALVTEETIAGGASTGSISGIHIMDDGVVLFNSSGTRSSIPSCAASFPARFSFDGATPAGQTKLAALMTAYSTGKQITIVGKSHCSLGWSAEVVNYFNG